MLPTFSLLVELESENVKRNWKKPSGNGGSRPVSRYAFCTLNWPLNQKIIVITEGKTSMEDIPNRDRCGLYWNIVLTASKPWRHRVNSSFLRSRRKGQNLRQLGMAGTGCYNPFLKSALESEKKCWYIRLHKEIEQHLTCGFIIVTVK